MTKQGDRIVYLNNAGQALLSPEVQQAGMDVIATPPWDEKSVAINDDKDSADDATLIRSHFAKLIGAQTNQHDKYCACQSNIAIMPSTAFAITFAAKNIFLNNHNNNNNHSGTGDEIATNCNTRTTMTGRILVLQDQMPSAVYPWQDICERSNGRIILCVVQYPTTTTSDSTTTNNDNNKHSTRTSWTAAILEKLQLYDDILVCCVPPLHWSDGALIDLEQIGKTCRERSIYFIVDATQAVGAFCPTQPFSSSDSTSSCCYNVSTIRPHLLTCTIHKWLRGPIGACLVYIAPELHDKWQPLDQHGRNRVVSDHARRNQIGPKGYPPDYLSDARKFDSGGKGNPVLLRMLRVSLQQVIQLDLKQLQEQLKHLLKPLLEWATAHGCSVPTSEHAYHLVGIRPPPPYMTVEEMETICNNLQQQEGIIIAVRCGVFRISPYLDNTTEDIQRLIDALSRYLLKRR